MILRTISGIDGPNVSSVVNASVVGVGVFVIVCVVVSCGIVVAVAGLVVRGDAVEVVAVDGFGVVVVIGVVIAVSVSVVVGVVRLSLVIVGVVVVAVVVVVVVVVVVFNNFVDGVGFVLSTGGVNVVKRICRVNHGCVGLVKYGFSVFRRNVGTFDLENVDVVHSTTMIDATYCSFFREGQK